MSARLLQDCFRQFRALLPTILLAYVPTLAVIGGITIFALSTGKRVWYFTEDPFVIGNLPFYAGILSNLGILFWCAGGVICFFSYAVLAKEESGGNYRRFLFFSGFFTSLFLFDDLFQMHRIFYHKYPNLTNSLVCGFYGLLVFWYLLYFKSQILKTEFLLLSFALIFFAMAVLVDIFSFLPRGNTAFSDGLKFFGIVGWFAYFARTCWKVLRKGA